MNANEGKRPVRVAIVCPGVGLVQRGFERLFYDIFKLTQGELDATLFKGGGLESEHEKVLSFLPRNGRFLQIFPIHHLIGRTPIHIECLTFVLALLPHLRGGRFDVVHCIDPPIARLLFHLRRMLGLRFRLLYTHACTMPSGNYPPADHLQQVSRETYDEALRDGIPAGAMTLLPVGIHPGNFESPRSREELRREHGVPADAFMILSVAALNRWHKRIHYLVDEVAKLDGNCILWLDGSLDQGEGDVADYAKTVLGERVRVTQVASGKVGELYRMADILAHAAYFEAFGLSIIEAAAAGLPVLVHDAPHFRWLMPNPGAWVDMMAPGALSQRLAFLIANPQALSEIRCGDLVRERFDWEGLRASYRCLLEQVAAMPQAPGGAGKNYFSKVHG